jgi:hypothetical protein
MAQQTRGETIGGDVFIQASLTPAFAPGYRGRSHRVRIAMTAKSPSSFYGFFLDLTCVVLGFTSWWMMLAVPVATVVLAAMFATSNSGSPGWTVWLVGTGIVLAALVFGIFLRWVLRRVAGYSRLGIVLGALLFLVVAAWRVWQAWTQPDTSLETAVGHGIGAAVALTFAVVLLLGVGTVRAVRGARRGR